MEYQGEEISPQEFAAAERQELIGTTEEEYMEDAATADKELAETAFLEEAAKEAPAAVVLKDVAEKAKRLIELKWDMEEKEESYLESKKQYDEFRCVTLPTFMKMSGLTLIATDGGARVEVKSKYYCKPNKNEADMVTIEAFLKEHKHLDLLQKAALVNTSQIKQLEEASIPFVEVKEVNTNSLKAWLKDQVGGNGGQVQIKMEDIPNCIHFIRMDECEIST